MLDIWDTGSWYFQRSEHTFCSACYYAQFLLDTRVPQNFHCSLIEDVRSRGIRRAAVPRYRKRLDTLLSQQQCSRGARGAGTNDDYRIFHVSINRSGLLYKLD